MDVMCHFPGSEIFACSSACIFDSSPMTQCLRSPNLRMIHIVSNACFANCAKTSSWPYHTDNQRQQVLFNGVQVYNNAST